MAESNKILTYNINLLIETTGLTDESFSNMMGFSLRKLKYVRKGDGTLKLIELIKVSNFFLVKDLATKTIIPDPKLRFKLLLAHKGNDEYENSLKEQPSIVYAIKQFLFINETVVFPIEVKKIRELFSKQGWFYTSSAISMALKRMPDFVKIEPHPVKKGTFVYSKK